MAAVCGGGKCMRHVNTALVREYFFTEYPEEKKLDFQKSYSARVSPPQ